MDWINEKENLKRLIEEEKISYEAIGRLYSISGAYVKKIAKKLGIKINVRRTINPSETFRAGTANKSICLNCGKEYISFPSNKSKFCSINCSNSYKSKEKYTDYVNNPSKYYGKSNMRWIKKFILEEQNNKCSICGISNIWNNKPLVFILDHIDGHANNNARNNLRLVCPNCDSQLDTYKSKNKNSDRTYYHNHHR